MEIFHFHQQIRCGQTQVYVEEVHKGHFEASISGRSGPIAEADSAVDVIQLAREVLKEDDAATASKGGD